MIDASPPRASQPATVLIADDHALVRDGMKMLVAGILKGVRIVEAQDGDSLLRGVRSDASVRLALVDLNMPGMHGGARLLELAEHYPQLPLVVVSALTSFDVVRRVMSVHTVHAFVPKSSGAGTMNQAIEAALAGRKLSIAQPRRTSVQPSANLTPRQEEIRNLLRQGCSNKMIASALGISPGTVKNHITEIFKILNTTNRTQAAQLDLAAD